MRAAQLHVGSVRFFILDEADQLLDTDNLDTILAIFAALPKARCRRHATRRPACNAGLRAMSACAHAHPRTQNTGVGGMHRLQVCFFSATLHSGAVQELADKICHRPQWVDLEARARTRARRGRSTAAAAAAR